MEAPTLLFLERSQNFCHQSSSFLETEHPGKCPRSNKLGPGHPASKGHQEEEGLGPLGRQSEGRRFGITSPSNPAVPSGKSASLTGDLGTTDPSWKLQRDVKSCVKLGREGGSR